MFNLEIIFYFILNVNHYKRSWRVEKTYIWSSPFTVQPLEVKANRMHTNANQLKNPAWFVILKQVHSHLPLYLVLM